MTADIKQTAVPVFLMGFNSFPALLSHEMLVLFLVTSVIGQDTALNWKKRKQRWMEDACITYLGNTDQKGTLTERTEEPH